MHHAHSWLCMALPRSTPPRICSMPGDTLLRCRVRSRVQGVLWVRRPVAEGMYTLPALCRRPLDLVRAQPVRR